MTEFEDTPLLKIHRLYNSREVALVLYKDRSVEQLPLKLYGSKWLDYDFQILLDFATQSSNDFLIEDPSNSFTYHLAEFILDECVCNFDRIFPLREETKLFSTLKTESLLLIKTLGRNSHLYNGMKYLLFLYYFEGHYSLVIVVKGQSEEFNVVIHYDPCLEVQSTSDIFLNFKSIFPNLTYFYCLGGDQKSDNWSSAHRCLSFVCGHFCDVRVDSKDLSRLISTLKHCEERRIISKKNIGCSRCVYCLLRTNNMCSMCRRPFCYEPPCVRSLNVSICKECFDSEETQSSEHSEEDYVPASKKRNLSTLVEEQISPLVSSIANESLDLESVQCNKDIASNVIIESTNKFVRSDNSPLESRVILKRCNLKSLESGHDYSENGNPNTMHNINKVSEEEIPLLESAIDFQDSNFDSLECETDDVKFVKNAANELNIDLHRPQISNLIAAFERTVCDKCGWFAEDFVVEKSCLHQLCRTCLNVNGCSLCNLGDDFDSFGPKRDTEHLYNVIIKVPGVIGNSIECPLCHFQSTHKNFLVHLEKAHNNFTAARSLRILRLFQTHYSTCKKSNVRIGILKQCPSCESAFFHLDNHVLEMRQKFTVLTESKQSKESVRSYFNCSIVNPRTVQPINMLKIIQEYKNLTMPKECLALKFRKFLLSTEGYDLFKAKKTVEKCKKLLKNHINFDTENFSLNQIGDFLGSHSNYAIIRNDIFQAISHQPFASGCSYIRAVRDEFVNFLFINDAICLQNRDVLMDELQKLQRSYEAREKNRENIVENCCMKEISQIAFSKRYLKQSHEMSEKILLIKEKEVNVEIFMSANYHILTLASLISGHSLRVALNIQVFEFVSALNSLEDYVSKNNAPPTFVTISVEQHNEREKGDAHICLPINVFLVLLSYFRNIRAKFAKSISKSYFTKRKRKDMTTTQNLKALKEITHNEDLHYFFVSQHGMHLQIVKKALVDNFRKFVKCDQGESNAFLSTLLGAPRRSHLVLSSRTEKESCSVCRYLCHSHAVRQQSYIKYSLRGRTQSVSDAITTLSKLKSVSPSTVAIF